MNRKRFVEISAGLAGAITTIPFPGLFEINPPSTKSASSAENTIELSADLVICGGGLGGCAAALAALRSNLKIILTEETDWIGGQLSQQGVPPDEHQWIETYGATRLYRDFRNSVRFYYKQNYPLTETARADKYLNPGAGSVSKLCHEPKAAMTVLLKMLTPFIESKKLILLTEYKIEAADVSESKVRSLKAVHQKNGNSKILSAPFFIDATELGDLLPLTGTEFITGSESRNVTRELHAPEKADPENNQAFTSCFAMDYIPGEDHLIEKPRDYDYWRNFRPDLKPAWPGKLFDFHYSNPATLEIKELAFNPEKTDTSPLLNLWTYRRIINKYNFKPDTYRSDITVVNWPQNDFMCGNLIGTGPEEFKKLVDSSKQLSLSLLYWLQTEAPRPGNARGWPGLRLRKDIMGTEDGLAKYPYIRESRRIKALFTILEEHVGKENRALVTGRRQDNTAADFYDSVGIGYYHIDLHPTCTGNNYIDFDSLPFQIPLGALIPERIENLVPANKNIGTTHITNGCYRLHPVEWNIGESAGSLIAFALSKKVTPAVVRENKNLLKDFQNLLSSQGIETSWPGIQEK
jgi:FAD dependent oxidoreductase